MRKRFTVGLALAAVLAAAAAAGLATHASAAPKKAALTKVVLQSKWVPQAQFAGYYAALALGYYKQAGLDVTIKNGGPDIIPEQVVASGQAQFGDRLAAEPPLRPRQGHRPGQHRAGVRAVRA